MTIKQQYEEFRYALSLRCNHHDFEVDTIGFNQREKIKQDFGPSAEPFGYPNLFHYRSLSYEWGFTLSGREKAELLYGKNPGMKMRRIQMDYSNIPEQFQCSCCDPSSYIITNDNQHFFKASAEPLTTDWFFGEPRIIFEVFRIACIKEELLDNATHNFYSAKELILKEKELQLSEQMLELAFERSKA